MLSLENEQMPMETYLIEKLNEIWNHGQSLSGEQIKIKSQLPVGLFTTEHRKTWFHVRQNLIKSRFIDQA